MGNFFSNDNIENANIQQKKDNKSDIENKYEEDNNILQTDLATNMIINNHINNDINISKPNYLKYRKKYLKEKQLYYNKK